MDLTFFMNKVAFYQRRRVLVAALAFVSTSIPAASCLASPLAGSLRESGHRIVIDGYGRKSQIPVHVSKFVCTGTGALRLAAYLQALDGLVA